jgi:hypothetical protein
MRFHLTIRLDGKTATRIEVPADVLAALGPGKRPKVQVTINGYTYPSTIGSMGGRSLILASAEVRAKAGVAAGDAVEADVVADTQSRTVEVPEDLAAALDRAPQQAGPSSSFPMAASAATCSPSSRPRPPRPASAASTRRSPNCPQPPPRGKRPQTRHAGRAAVRAPGCPRRPQDDARTGVSTDLADHQQRVVTRHWIQVA